MREGVLTGYYTGSKMAHMESQSDDLPLSFRLPRVEWQTLTQVAREKGYSRSELCRLFLRWGLQCADNFPAKKRTAADVITPDPTATA